MSPAALQPPAEVWARVCAFMQAQCGVQLGADQAYLLGPRLGPLARRHGFASVAEFVAAAYLVPAGHLLQRAMIDAMTTHESSFFRDSSFWRGLETNILPALLAGGRPQLHIWSAACSFGQEAYSLAMLLDELHPGLAARSTVVASDVSGEAIERGQRGIYGSLEVSRGCDKARLTRHFDPVEGGFQVKTRLRERIRWRTHNLLQPLSGAPLFDLVFCRNVLIYFNVEQRRATVNRLLAATAPGGFIGLGNTEQGWSTQAAPGWYAVEKKPEETKKP